ncbi:hypothetical protein B0H19DRAFT_1309833 [Mycena capillaripes]|nr:hypothetical protein B0H19DRAFT_1309833 [Mycena capillaripes]
MSILVNGVYTSRLYTSSVSPVTVVSSAFVRSRLPPGQSRTFALTINGGIHGSFTAVLPCFVSPHLAVDICLGLDWKASVREWLIGLGQQPTNDESYLSAVDPNTPGPAQIPSLAPLMLMQAAASPSSATVSPPIVTGSRSGTGTIFPSNNGPSASSSHTCDHRSSAFALVSSPAHALVQNPAYVPLQTHTMALQYITPTCEKTTPVPGPSSELSVSGPVFLSASVGLDTLFLSPDKLCNILNGDDSCLHTHLTHHGLSSSGLTPFEARQSLAFHLMTGIVILSSSELSDMQVRVLSKALGLSLSDSEPELTRSELLQNLSLKRTTVMHELSVSYLLEYEAAVPD